MALRECQISWDRIIRPGADVATVMAMAAQDDDTPGTRNLNHDEVARLMRNAALCEAGPISSWIIERLDPVWGYPRSLLATSPWNWLSWDF